MKWGHELRNVGAHYKLENTRTWILFRASRMESALVGQQTKGQTDCKVRAGYEGMEYKVRPLKMFVLLLSVHPLPPSLVPCTCD